MRKRIPVLLCAAMLLSVAATVSQAAETDMTQETSGIQDTQDGLVAKASDILKIQESYQAYADLVSQYEEKY